MRFLSSVLLLLAVVLVICVPYFVGHGLALGSSRWIVAGVISGFIAAGLIFAVTRLWPREAARGSHT